MGLHLPRWVWIGAIALSCVAGMVNVVGFLGFEHQALSHVSGSTSQLGIALVQGSWRAAADLTGLLLAFLLGALLSGLIVQNDTLQLGRRYGVALGVESLLLLVAIPLFKQHQVWGAFAAAMACGLQNALATTFSGTVVRTTHLTGMFTDLGIGIGHALRGRPMQVRRMTLSTLIITGFLGGGVAGAWLFSYWKYDALLVPAALTGLSGLAYVIYRQWQLSHPH